LSEGKTFLMADRELDSARTGPRWLNDAGIARCVIAALYRGEHELHQYVLRAFAIMPNHVHVLIEPSVSLARITNGLKGVLLAKPISYSGKRADISGKTNRSTIGYEMAPNTIESQGISNRIPSPPVSSKIPRTGHGRAPQVGQPLLAVHEGAAP
jgi:hypothetical protein